MTKLKPIQLDENTIIYVEATEDSDTSEVRPEPSNGLPEQSRTAKGVADWRSPQATVMQKSVQTLENTIRYYTTYTLNAFKQVAIAEVRKVTLEFGVNMSGATGVPYIATGTAGCNVKVTVECAFPEQSTQ